MVEIIIQSLIVGWIGFILIGSIYCWVIIPLYVRFKWKKILLSINTLPTKDKNIIKYIQLFSEHDINKHRYILERDLVYKNYDNICDIYFSNNISSFKLILKKLDKLNDSNELRTNIMSSFENLNKKDDLCCLYQLENYLDKQLKTLIQCETDFLKERKLLEQNTILNKLKEHLFKTNNSKLYFIIITYFENNLIELNDIVKLIEIFTDKSTEEDVRNYINTIILTKGVK